jgi:hypothetical protein
MGKSAPIISQAVGDNVKIVVVHLKHFNFKLAVITGFGSNGIRNHFVKIIPDTILSSCRLLLPHWGYPTVKANGS